MTTAGAQLLQLYLAIHSVTRAEFGRRIGVDVRAIDRWISGQYRPDLRSAIKVESATGIPAKKWFQYEAGGEETYQRKI